MSRQYFAVTVIYHGITDTKIAYTKHISENENEVINICQHYQSIKGIRHNKLNWGVEPITIEDKKLVESGQTVYL